MQRDGETRRIAVSPPKAFEARGRLFDALRQAHPAVFEPRELGEWGGYDAAIAFGGDADRAGSGEHDPAYRLFFPDGAATPGRTRVQLADAAALDPVLRERRLDEDHAGAQPLAVAPGETVLAAAGRDPLWSSTAGGAVHRAAVAPPDLCSRSGLRTLLGPRRWLSLVPLEHFLREVTAPLAWELPPLRAALMYDDPNLHWPSYGRLRFADLAQHASLHGYHAAIAMVPLDGRFVHPSVGKLFRERADVLSLAMHGNDHIRLELYRDMRPDVRCAVIAQALRRSDAFERRYGIQVDRVMSGPHGLSAEDAIAAMFSLGVEGFAGDWPFPWAPPDTPPDGWPLAGWQPAQLIHGLPVLPRSLFTSPADDVVFRAFLRQPLIAYGHHDAGGDVLGAVARHVNGLGDVRWQSLEEIARSNYAVRRAGATLLVKPYSRRFAVEVPAGVDELVVEVDAGYGTLAPPVVDAVSAGAPLAGAAASGGRRSFLPPEGGGMVEIVLRPAVPVDPERVAEPPWGSWPVFRRVLTEARDRTLLFIRPES